MRRVISANAATIRGSWTFSGSTPGNLPIAILLERPPSYRLLDLPL
jgi:hypothetical protein